MIIFKVLECNSGVYYHNYYSSYKNRKPTKDKKEQKHLQIKKGVTLKVGTRRGKRVRQRERTVCLCVCVGMSGPVLSLTTRSWIE